MVDAADLKSAATTGVPVRVRRRAYPIRYCAGTRYFGWTALLSPGVPGGGMTGMSLAVEGGFAATPGAISGGLSVPFDLESLSLIVTPCGSTRSGGTRFASLPVGGGCWGTGWLVCA